VESLKQEKILPTFRLKKKQNIMLYLDEITKVFKGKVLLNESLAPYTSLKLGGPADVVLQPTDKQDVIEAIKWIKKYNQNYYVIGYGTNLLVSDFTSNIKNKLQTQKHKKQICSIWRIS
jgi:hypothetical protein